MLCSLPEHSAPLSRESRMSLSSPQRELPTSTQPRSRNRGTMQLASSNPARHLAARMGRWSASHRKTAVFGWLAFVISAIVIGTAIGAKTIDQSSNNSAGPSLQADQILKHGGFPQS